MSGFNFSPKGSGWKIRLSITERFSLTRRGKPACPRTSRFKSRPGAISMTVNPSGSRLSTQRSVMYNTLCLSCCALRPLKVTWSTSGNKFLVFAFFGDAQLVVLHPKIETSGREVPAEKDRASGSRDVDESAAAGRHVRTKRQSRDVHIPELIDLKERETAAVKTAALKERELVWRRNDGVRV